MHMMGGREFHDGAKDGLEALEPLNPDKIRSFDDLLIAMDDRGSGLRGRDDAFGCHDDC
jgi:deoxyhypusine synthase